MIKSVLPAVIFVSIFFCITAQASAISESCRPAKIKEIKQNADYLYNINDQYSLVIGHDISIDTPTEYGVRLMLYKQTGKMRSRAYYSKGASDSYILRPTFIKSCGGHEFLIFAEMGTEYSWGLRVFSYDSGNIMEIGEIPLAVEGEDGEGDEDSVIPFMRIFEKNNSALISFTKDLVWNPGSPDSRKILKSQIKYQLKGNKLSEFLH